MRQRNLIFTVVFSMLAVACAADEQPAALVEPTTTTAPAMAEPIVEDAVVSKDAPVDVFLDAGWTIGNEGFLVAPGLEFEGDTTPADLFITMTFTNKSGYNLDLAAVVTNDFGSESQSLPMDPDGVAMLYAPFTDGSAVGFALSQAGSDTTYSFFGERGGAPCKDRMGELEGGDVVDIEFQPTDSMTLGFPGVLTVNGVDQCTFGMLTRTQSFMVEHPGWTVVIAVVAASAVAVTGFKAAKGVKSIRARRADAAEFSRAVEAVSSRAPEMLAAELETISEERKLLADMERLIGEGEDLVWQSKRADIEAIAGFEEEERLLTNEAFVRRYASEDTLKVLESQLLHDSSLYVGMSIEDSEIFNMAEFQDFSNARFKAVKAAGLAPEAQFPTNLQRLDNLEAYLNQRKIAERVKEIEAAEPTVYREVMTASGDKFTYEALADATFDVEEWETLYYVERTKLGIYSDLPV